MIEYVKKMRKYIGKECLILVGAGVIIYKFVFKKKRMLVS